MGETDESSAMSKTGVSEEKGAEVRTPYSLYASDNPRVMITSVVLTGENYNEWSSEMMNALRAKRKLGFIEGTIPKPSADDPNLELWYSVNSMIVGWIRTSIEPRVRSTVTFIQDSHKLWENLRKRFSVGNKVRIHHLKSSWQFADKKDKPSSTILENCRSYGKSWTCTSHFPRVPAVRLQSLRRTEKKKRYISLSWVWIKLDLE